MGFKNDTDFFRSLTMGVYAADAITQDLQDNHGHRIIELERYAKANKLWRTKVKRMRLPDLMCIRCGLRIESKGKKELKVKISDSRLPGREWRDGGMRLDDVFAFARVDMTTTPVTVANLIYVTRRDLEAALPSSKESKRKSVSEGSELDRSWPMWTPSFAGTVTEIIDTENARKVKVAKEPTGSYPYRNATEWKSFHSLAVGERFEAGQPVAYSFRMVSSVTCADTPWEWQADLTSPDDDIRFPAVKAARFLGARQVEAMLLAISDEANDWRVRLEAHASLAPHRPESLEALKLLAEGQKSTAEERMEAVFALSEIDTASSAEALFSVAGSADPVIPEEVRAAAAWGLGTGARTAPDKLMPLLDDPSVLVSTHAAAVLPEELSQLHVDHLQTWLIQDNARRAATSAHLLAERGRVKELAKALEEAPAHVRRIIVLALGDCPREAVLSFLGDLDDESRAGVLTLWARDEDWLRQPETDGVLDALKQQTLRR